MQKLGATIAAALLAVIAAGPAAAQDAGGYSTGQPVGEAAQPGQPERPKVYVRDTFDDWQVQCLPLAEGNERCELYQLLRDAGGNPVAEIRVGQIPPGSNIVAGATVLTPLGTLLTQQLRFQVDSGEARIYPYSVCTQQGCVARLGFTAPELGALEKGNVAVVTIVAAANTKEPVSLNVPLKGFSKAYASLFD